MRPQLFHFLGPRFLLVLGPLVALPRHAALTSHARSRLPCNALTRSPLARSIMTAQEIEYSEKYFDDEFEYRCSPALSGPRPRPGVRCML